ncbi:helix-turn-helix domain-containing protein [Microvirga sp. VF16]|uniref:helix-turn-helix domain-containing protein n=1 Tax=Microvirga sp. VF16 TaxID=2807101 RepID=UPI0035303230
MPGDRGGTGDRPRAYEPGHSKDPEQFQAAALGRPVPSRPLVTAPLAAKLLQVTPKAVDLMLAQLGASLSPYCHASGPLVEP